MAILARTRRRDGKRVHQVRLRDPGGRQYARSFDTRREAQLFELVQKVDQAGCGWIDPQVVRTPFDQVAQRWLDVGDNKRPRSIGRDKAVVNGHLLPVFKDRPVPSITSKQVQILVNKWSKTHAASMMARMFSVFARRYELRRRCRDDPEVTVSTYSAAPGVPPDGADPRW